MDNETVSHLNCVGSEGRKISTETTPPYKRRRKRKLIIPDCHPDRPHHALGKCRECYSSDYFSMWFKINKEKKNKDNRIWHVNKQKRHPDYSLHQNLKHYGLTPEQYREIGDRQNWLCAICGLPERAMKRGQVQNLAVDHDHNKSIGDDGFIRGLLCRSCNTGIGNLKDNPELLYQAAEYLRFHGNRT